MKIAIIVAMGKELDLLLPLLNNPTSEDRDGCTFHYGTIGLHDVVVMQCGIGKVNAAMGTTTLISHFAPEVVINTGVAGGADKVVNVMDVVVGSQVAYHDVWCGPESVQGAIQGLPLYFDGDEQLLSKLPVRGDVKRGLICSGDHFIDKMEDVVALKEQFPEALAVDMESAAIAHVCYKRGVRFLSLRVISDSPGAGHNNTTQYVDFWADAPKHTFTLVKSLLEHLGSNAN